MSRHNESNDDVRVHWVNEGMLIPPEKLAEAWGQSISALEDALERHALFRLQAGEPWFYPAVFACFPPDDVHRINRALKGEDDVGKFIFWHRRHGGLGARDLSQALRDGMLDRVLELALGWSEERGFFQG
ncbi:MAG: hypothetical protein DI587_24740 [Variovorax paradoxus]|nr:MAG: hypothetical protein DI583_24740 [Variovorax paradoxus]PZQ05424.1 MAG: hypothetical protein DI587_24740 [Variovorax paradoxus]